MLLVALALLLAQAVTASTLSPEFRAWMLTHDKSYSSQHEAQRRQSTFEENVNLIAKLNFESMSSGSSVRYEINAFADLSPQEFESTYLMPSRLSPTMPEESFLPSQGNKDIPAAFDWRNHSAVTAVRNQGSTGTCWAFSTIENIESQWFLKGNNLTELSVEMLVDCDNSSNPKNQNADCGVFGGWPYLAYGFLGLFGGIEPEADYPYCCGTGACYPCMAPGFDRAKCGPPPTYCNKTESCYAKLNRANFVPGLQVSGYVAIAKNETEMASRLVELGPLSILIDASGLQFYKSGVWNPDFCSKTETDHAVQLVGYGVSASQELYWIVRNSWGLSWGDQGYFLLERGVNACAVDTGVTCGRLE